MGIKHHIFNIIFTLNFIEFLNKVSVLDTIFSGKKFVEHVVDAGESLNSG